MNRPFGFGWIWALATLVIASVVGVIAFIAGHATEVATTNDVGRAVNDGYYYGHGFGFFPFFGFLWFLLIVFVLFAVFRRGFGWKRGYWGGGRFWYNRSYCNLGRGYGFHNVYNRSYNGYSGRAGGTSMAVG